MSAWSEGRCCAEHDAAKQAGSLDAPQQHSPAAPGACTCCVHKARAQQAKQDGQPHDQVAQQAEQAQDVWHDQHSRANLLPQIGNSHGLCEGPK